MSLADAGFAAFVVGILGCIATVWLAAASEVYRSAPPGVVALFAFGSLALGGFLLVLATAPHRPGPLGRTNAK